MFRIQFCEFIKKVETRPINGETAIKVQVCRKNYAKEGTEPTFSWLNITVFKAPPWMVEKAIVGAYIAGSGEWTLRSYEKDGQKRQAAECECRSFDVEIVATAPKDGAAPAQPAAPAGPKKYTPPPLDDGSDVPF